jgi:hypothetical protein
MAPSCMPSLGHAISTVGHIDPLATSDLAPHATSTDPSICAKECMITVRHGRHSLVHSVIRVKHSSYPLLHGAMDCQGAPWYILTMLATLLRVRRVGSSAVSSTTVSSALICAPCSTCPNHLSHQTPQVQHCLRECMGTKTFISSDNACAALPQEVHGHTPCLAHRLKSTNYECSNNCSAKRNNVR